MLGDSWNLLSALGGIKDIETRLVLGELMIPNRIINSAIWRLGQQLFLLAGKMVLGRFAYKTIRLQDDLPTL